ncbi:hypothetical protein ACIOG8_20275 [Streptomyces erythrochromogenes]|uniref:hypothetical protein n=1 Tax=Streptomyces erythrochromogenes TaxID=285574 RepID=UPI003818DC88
MAVPLDQAEAEFFRMLGHPARTRVLELLQDAPMSVGRRIPTEVLTGQSEALEELRESEVPAP